MICKKVFLDNENKEVYLDVYTADKIKSLTRKAILVIPGGGYGVICSEREGEPIGMAFMPYGYNAFVLHYTISRKKPFPAQLIEATLAIKHIKDNAEEYGIDPNEIFVTGFSAGGHLTAACGVLWKNEDVLKAVDMPYGYNKPKGIIPVYPVISGVNNPNIETFQNLLCTDEPTEQQLLKYSLERYVDMDSSPAFIVHTSNDEMVDVRNSLAFAGAYADAGMKFELHIYPDGPHGVALGNRVTECGCEKYNNASIAKWVENAVFWADNL